ncbi:MAG: hypothetical protein QNJ09_03960 [Paracoccaceae bacterium]|nr:hypothetical protein [Paracoccaceae bacterium]
MTADLDARMLAAHAAGDRDALITLYTEAADHADTPDAAYFYLTHAYVFALEAGDERAGPLHARLKSAGREA